MKYILLLLVLVCYTNGYIVDPGPKVIATKGAIWPKPLQQTTYSTFSVIRPSSFSFESVNHTCDILTQAFVRYRKIIGTLTMRKLKSRLSTVNERDGKKIKKTWRSDPQYEGNLEVVHVNLKNPCETKPYLGMDESYTLSIIESEASIESFSVWGILRGLESFSQLLFVNEKDLSIKINSTKITDEPRFSHRGLLLDTSRHFMSLFTIYQMLDGMAYNKLNVFHWHIVDDHSFPYESIEFPELSEQGAYNPRTMTYSQNDVKNVIEYARLRGIRVMSEFDTPGHTRSWGVSHPELLTKCAGEFKGKLGPMNPINEQVYVFMDKLLKEIVKVFPDQYVHLGGDEVEFECWQSNADITEYMKKNNVTTYQMLEGIFIQRIVDNVKSLNASSMVWQEVFVNGVKLPKETVVHIWTGDYKQLLFDVTNAELPALLSACWYLDHLSTGGDWKKFYDCDPHSFQGTEKQKKLVMGGEACMWSETVDNTNVLQRIFPRVSATAEKLWSQIDVTDIDDASKRLEEHACRMKLRGIPAQPPNGPGYCAV